MIDLPPILPQRKPAGLSQLVRVFAGSCHRRLSELLAQFRGHAQRVRAIHFAARTIAKMPARSAGGSVGHASTTAPKSASAGTGGQTASDAFAPAAWEICHLPEGFAGFCVNSSPTWRIATLHSVFSVSTIISTSITCLPAIFDARRVSSPRPCFSFRSPSGIGLNCLT
jgi:hypothetical protein